MSSLQRRFEEMDRQIPEQSFSVSTVDSELSEKGQRLIAERGSGVLLLETAVILYLFSVFSRIFASDTTRVYRKPQCASGKEHGIRL